MLRFKPVFFAVAVGAISAAAASSLGEHMNEHFARGTMIQTAVINGDLAMARHNAGWLVEHPPIKGIPADAEVPMREASRMVLEATELSGAAAGVGNIGAACGTCHLSQGVNPGIESVVDMEYGVSLPARMARHQWGVDRMWEGLVNPSSSLWIQGAEALLESPLSGSGGGDETGHLIDALGQEVFDLANRARKTRGQAKRGELYGELLTTCAVCHGVIRDSAPAE